MAIRAIFESKKGIFRQAKNFAQQAGAVAASKNSERKETQHHGAGKLRPRR